MFGDYWLEITPEEYVLDVSENGDQSLCIFALSKNSENFNVFGGILRSVAGFFGRLKEI